MKRVLSIAACAFLLMGASGCCGSLREICCWKKTLANHFHHCCDARDACCPYTDCNWNDNFHCGEGGCGGDCGGGCGDCDQGCGDACGSGKCGHGHWLGWLKHRGCSRKMGCGQKYYDEWKNDPPACCDPCDSCGNYTGARRLATAAGGRHVVRGSHAAGEHYLAEGGAAGASRRPQMAARGSRAAPPADLQAGEEQVGRPFVTDRVVASPGKQQQPVSRTVRR